MDEVLHSHLWELVNFDLIHKKSVRNKRCTLSDIFIVFLKFQVMILFLPAIFSTVIGQGAVVPCRYGNACIITLSLQSLPCPFQIICVPSYPTSFSHNRSGTGLLLTRRHNTRERKVSKRVSSLPQSQVVCR